MYVCERERESEGADRHTYACVCERERERECVCVCVWVCCSLQNELAQALVDVFVVRDTLPNVASETVNGKVHFAEPDGFGNLLLPVNRNIRDGLLVVIHKRRRLNKHAD